MLFLVKQKLKKASFIIISILITLFLTGNYFIYKQVTKSHKKEFKAFIRSHYAHKEKISINPSELYSNNKHITWLDHNKEILLNDVMYDILEIQNSGTEVILTVVKDTEEKELMERYKNQFNEIYSANSKNKSGSSAKDFFGMKYLIFQNKGLNLISSTITYPVKITSFSSEVYFPVNCPPPKFG